MSDNASAIVPRRVLGIETSCDETSAAVVYGTPTDMRLESLVILSQDVHRLFGGVVPEIASRQHLTGIVPAVRTALADAHVSLGDLDAIAVTHAPGLVGALLVGTSYGGGAIPMENVVRSSDFLLLHGNGVKNPARITEMIQQTRAVPGYKPMPILFNEDDHENFDKPANNFAAAIAGHVSWGWFDYRRKGEALEEGYQSPPVNWGISSERKRAFFQYLAEITGVQNP